MDYGTQMELRVHTNAPCGPANDAKLRALATSYARFRPARKLNLDQFSHEPSPSYVFDSLQSSAPDPSPESLVSPDLSFKSADGNATPLQNQRARTYQTWQGDGPSRPHSLFAPKSRRCIVQSQPDSPIETSSQPASGEQWSVGLLPVQTSFLAEPPQTSSTASPMSPTAPASQASAGLSQQTGVAPSRGPFAMPSQQESAAPAGRPSESPSEQAAADPARKTSANPLQPSAAVYVQLSPIPPSQPSASSNPPLSTPSTSWKTPPDESRACTIRSVSELPASQSSFVPPPSVVPDSYDLSQPGSHLQSSTTSSLRRLSANNPDIVVEIPRDFINPVADVTHVSETELGSTQNDDAHPSRVGTSNDSLNGAADGKPSDVVDKNAKGVVDAEANVVGPTVPVGAIGVGSLSPPLRPAIDRLPSSKEDRGRPADNPIVFNSCSPSSFGPAAKSGDVIGAEARSEQAPRSMDFDLPDAVDDMEVGDMDMPQDPSDGFEIEAETTGPLLGSPEDLETVNVAPSSSLPALRDPRSIFPKDANAATGSGTSYSSHGDVGVLEPQPRSGGVSLGDLPIDDANGAEKPPPFISAAAGSQLASADEAANSPSVFLDRRAEAENPTPISAADTEPESSPPYQTADDDEFPCRIPSAPDTVVSSPGSSAAAFDERPPVPHVAHHILRDEPDITDLRRAAWEEASQESLVSQALGGESQDDADEVYRGMSGPPRQGEAIPDAELFHQRRPAATGASFADGARARRREREEIEETHQPPRKRQRPSDDPYFIYGVGRGGGDEEYMHTYISEPLRKLAEQLDLPRRMATVKKLREPLPCERGFWHVVCTGWEVESRDRVWNYLAMYFGGGAAGPCVSAVRNKAKEYIKVYCWGYLSGHIYLLLYLASDRAILFAPCSWHGSDGRMVMSVRPRAS